MADVALAQAPTATVGPAAERTAQRHRMADQIFERLTQSMAVMVLLILGGIAISIAIGAWPAFQAFGFGFLITEVWNPVTEEFGALAPIYGTIITSILAMLFAVPVGFGIAVFLTELSPPILRRPLGIAVELLAGIPSIIYGIWGLFVLAPFLQGTIQPWLIASVGEIPWVGSLFQGPPYGIGIFTAGLVLGVMILPFIAAITRDVFDTVPTLLRESAYGVGCTTWEVVWHVVLPYTRVGVVGGAMLALGRALGETMAVTFVVGNAHRISGSILSPGTTISASIANEFTEATGALYTASLIALGLVLFFITFIVLSLAKLMLARMNRMAGT